MNQLWRWSRLAPAKWEDSWTERLQFLGPGGFAIIGWPGSRSIRIEAFCDSRTAKKLSREFGGRLTKVRDWQGGAQPARKPLRIRGRLTIHGDEDTFSNAAPQARHSHILIPAGMAFGTGEHATTASCLRMLCDIAGSLPPRWCAVDAGTGSGILAIAAAALGAESVEAFDFDAACVRIARANARTNRARQVGVRQLDVRKWRPSRRCHVAMANLYSELLMESAPRLFRATRKDGHLLFSGVLRTQLDEVCRVLEKSGFQICRTVIRGKWSAGHCRPAEARKTGNSLATGHHPRGDKQR